MAGVDLDPWGRETNRGWNQSQFTRRHTTYERDGNQSDEAMHRRYNRWHLRFDQPDPYKEVARRAGRDTKAVLPQECTCGRGIPHWKSNGQLPRPIC